jgi:Flp pilus assembly protein TadD
MICSKRALTRERASLKATLRGLPLLLGSVVLSLGCGGGDQRPQIDSEFRLSLAELLIQSKAYDEAIPIIQKALISHPNDARLHYLLGVTLRDKGVYTEAEKVLLKTLRLDPKLATGYNALGVLYSLMSRSDQALIALKEAIKLAPRVARFHNNIGFAYALRGAPKEAVEAYRTALRLAPSEPRVFVNLGFALGALGQDQEAERMFNQALSRAEVLNNLGLVFERRGDLQVALKYYQSALDKSPRLKSAQQNIDAVRLKIDRAREDESERPPSKPNSSVPSKTNTERSL